MRKTNFKRFYIWILSSLIVMTLIFAGVNVGAFKAFAATSSSSIFSGIDGSPNGETLYNATNTYDYNGDNNLDERTYVYYNTSIDGENSNIVSAGAPLITVLTHGLGGEASHWSNVNGKFTYDEDSMFARLQQELLKDGGSGANIYWAVMQNSTEFKLYDLNDEGNRTVREQGTASEYIECTMSQTTTAITDISKHIILIFQSSVPDEYNYQVYEEFNYMLSKIIYDVKILSGGELPRINLIGHSRGGLTNLQYALDHPALVASMFSLGTPYFGSDTAATSLGAELAPGNGRLDIISRDIYLDYFDRWYNGYNKMYSGIDAHALGGYSDSDYLFDTLIEDKSFVSGYISDGALTAIKWAIKSLPGLVNSLNGTGEIADFLVSLFRNEGYSESELESYIQILADIQYISDDDDEGFWSNLWDNIVHNIPFIGSPYFMNDLLVDLSSQIGFDQHSDTYRSYGFYVYIKCYENSDYSNGKLKKLSSSNMPAVVHNLEARDKDMINYILSRIPLGNFNSGYIYNQTSETTATLSGYRGGILSGEIELPSQINGLIIDRVDTDLFKGFGGEITSISIPATVKYIDDNAFINMKALTTVVFQSGSTLVSIGSGAFAKCGNLQSFVIPGTVTNIACDAFAGCSKLSSITVDTANPYYSSINGILFNKAETELLYYPEGKTGTSYTVPTSVTEIAPFAFYGNSKLATLNLNNVGMIRQYALSGCENLATIQAPNLNYVEIGAFDGTKWLENQTSDVVKLGNVFVLYQGTASELSIEGVTSIAPMAFANNETLETVTLNNGLVNIGDGAFYGCSNLETVYICNKSDMIFVSNASFDANAEGRVIYVPYNLQGEYKDNELWKQYEDSIKVHQTNITYVLNGGICDVTSGAVYYQDYLDLPVPSKNGNTFKGWYDNAAFSGVALNEQTMWDSLAENVTFYAKWEENTYKALLHPKGGTVTPIEIEYKISDGSKTLPEPSRVGYTFEGWYEKEDYSGTSVTAIPARTYEDKNYYAKWESIEYMVQLSPNYPGATNGEQYVPYGKVVYISAPNRTGYDFLGWAYNDELYTDDKGLLNDPWAFTERVTLVAQWQAKESTIVIAIGSTTYEYTIFYDEMIQLPKPTKVGYTFQYWCDETGKQYTDSSGMMIIPWDKEDEVVEFVAYWRLNTYTVVYNKNGGSGTMSSIIHTYGVYKNLSTNLFYKTGHNFIGWSTSSTGNAVYSNGESVVNLSLVDGEMVTLYAVWEAKTYNIIYKNLMPEMSVYPSTYTYGEGLQTMPTIYLSGGYYSTPLENFYGWYTSANFTTRVYSISTTQTGDVTVYAKYDYWISSTYASYTSTVTDDGINKQPSFGVDVFLDSIYFDRVKNTTLDKIKIVISFDMWEVNDGYQDLYLYNGDTKIWSQTINRGSGKDTSAKNYTFTIELDLYEYQNVDFMDLKFSAHGNFSDTWEFNNFEMSIYFTN